MKNKKIWIVVAVIILLICVGILIYNFTLKKGKIAKLDQSIETLTTDDGVVTTKDHLAQMETVSQEFESFKKQISDIATEKGQTPESNSTQDIIDAIIAMSGSFKVSSGIPTTSYSTKGIVVASVYRGLVSGGVTDSATLTIKKNNATLKTITCTTTCDTSVEKVPGSAKMVTEQFEVDLGPSNTYSFSITNGNQWKGGYGYSCYTIYQ